MRAATQRGAAVDRQARTELSRLRRSLKRLVVEAGTRGWLKPAQATAALRILRLRHE